jgi:hypothetical protein
MDTRALTPGDEDGVSYLCLSKISSVPSLLQGAYGQRQTRKAVSHRGWTYSAPVSQSKPIRPSATQLYRHLRTHRTMFGGDEEFWRDSRKSHTPQGKSRGSASTLRSCTGSTLNPPAEYCRSFYILANPLPRVGHRHSLWLLACITDQMWSHSRARAWCLSENAEQSTVMVRDPDARVLLQP